MKIEVLYSDFLLYGERGNVEYLEKTFGKENVVKTQLNDRPYFADNKVDFIYMGPMTEKQLEMVTEKLLPFKDKLKSMIEDGTYFLIVNSALEIFGRFIELENGFRLKTLDLLPFTTMRNMSKRHDVAVLGSFENIQVIGYDARFTEQYGNEEMPFLKVERGYGFSKKSLLEGVHYKNFFGTNILGPILITNPPLMKLFKKALTGTEDLPFEKDVVKAYEVRLDKFRNDKEFINQH